MANRKSLMAVVLLSAVALVISSYLLYIKYTGAESFCDFSDELSCDLVSQSPYSEFPPNSGIPLAGLGMLAYLLLLAPAAFLLDTERTSLFRIGRLAVRKLMLLWGLFMVAFYAYLTYLELYVIHAICPLCVSTFALSILLLVPLSIGLRGVKQKEIAHFYRRTESMQTQSSTQSEEPAP